MFAQHCNKIFEPQRFVLKLARKKLDKEHFWGVLGKHSSEHNVQISSPQGIQIIMFTVRSTRQEQNQR